MELNPVVRLKLSLPHRGSCFQTLVICPHLPSGSEPLHFTPPISSVLLLSLLLSLPMLFSASPTFSQGRPPDRLLSQKPIVPLLLPLILFHLYHSACSSSSLALHTTFLYFHLPLALSYPCLHAWPIASRILLKALLLVSLSLFAVITAPVLSQVSLKSDHHPHAISSIKHGMILDWSFKTCTCLKSVKILTCVTNIISSYWYYKLLYLLLTELNYHCCYFFIIFYSSRQNMSFCLMCITIKLTRFLTQSGRFKV